ncbi:glycosyltransferase [Microbacterium sp.]|uniref:glycosyltransferase n=1 Tax=Microbacterium sp. TaxID=51671 RepID=UPI0035B383C4
MFSAFRPDQAIVDAVRSVAGQLSGPVVVVDDGSGAGYEHVWSALSEAGARVVRREENQGIAGALNHGIRVASAGDAVDAVITFDQDSTVDDGFVSALVEAEGDAVRRGHGVGVVVPEFFAGVSQVRSRRPDGTLLARHAIQSGMLIPRRTIEAVGLLREDLFIDLVDTEYELRCHVAGLASVAAPGVRLGHALGRQYRRESFGRPVSLPGIPPVVTLSTPFRYYYRVRNRRVVNRLYLRRAPAWILRDSLVEVLHFGNAWMLARPRRALWRLYRGGWRDAGAGRLGRIPDSLEREAASISWAAPPA